MSEVKRKIIKTLILTAVLVSSTSLVNAQTAPIEEQDSIHKYYALENKIPFLYTGNDSATAVEENTVVEDTTEKDNLKKLENITESQARSIEISNEVMDAINDRSGVRTLLLGNSLGVLRFQVAQMKDQIYALGALAKKAESGTRILQINDQINILKKQIAKVDNFILEHEDSFSMFGWLVSSL
jgi:hypothetical protein